MVRRREKIDSHGSMDRPMNVHTGENKGNPYDWTLENKEMFHSLHCWLLFLIIKLSLLKLVLGCIWIHIYICGGVCMVGRHWNCCLNLRHYTRSHPILHNLPIFYVQSLRLCRLLLQVVYVLCFSLILKQKSGHIFFFFNNLNV